MNTLTDRQKIILHTVIESHIRSAQPIGSRYVSENFRLGYSPATIRHEMNTLEDRGLLTHPHISSGRIPTDTGYRYYADSILEGQSIPADFRPQPEAVTSWMESPGEDMESRAEQASRLLAALSEEVSLIFFEESRPREFLKVTRSRAKMMVQGTPYILEKPEFQDRRKVKALFKVFEDRTTLADWISRRTETDEVAVTIGRENENEVLWDCAIVASRYTIRERAFGSVAVIGPRRMQYAVTIPLVRQIAAAIERSLN